MFGRLLILDNFATHTVEAGTVIEVLEADGVTISNVTL